MATAGGGEVKLVKKCNGNVSAILKCLEDKAKIWNVVWGIKVRVLKVLNYPALVMLSLRMCKEGELQIEENFELPRCCQGCH